jgi:hypothetical protein
MTNPDFFTASHQYFSTKNFITCIAIFRKQPFSQSVFTPFNHPIIFLRHCFKTGYENASNACKRTEHLFENDGGDDDENGVSSERKCAYNKFPKTNDSTS